MIGPSFEYPSLLPSYLNARGAGCFDDVYVRDGTHRFERRPPFGPTGPTPSSFNPKVAYALSAGSMARFTAFLCPVTL